MPASPHNTDDALLARLNALKQSSVSSLSTAPPPAAAETTPDALRELGVEDGTGGAAAAGRDADGGDPILDLAARFRRLNGGKAAAAGEGGAADGGEKTLDELLRELGGDRAEWDVGREEERDVGRLVREVRSVLPDVPRPERGGSAVREDVGAESGAKGGEEGDVDQGALDEQEADDYIARVLAELDLETKYGDGDGEDKGTAGELEKAPVDVGDQPPRPSARDAQSASANASAGEDASAQSSLSLPTPPESKDDLPKSPAMKDDFDKATAVDDMLAARLAALSRDSPSPGPGGASSLPSAPSFAPSKKPPVKATKFTDEEIDSWCIICYANATLRCLGCDGDLYCQGCWIEGHRGESAGYEERSHRAVQFVKGGGPKKTAVGA
ncbi:hypothetical protein MPH_00603 [Macrophomina phaseolina MS6]|uniref:Uncharacterized protein n=1 Tax=Macrophomina phaseolina (strain MS6) TaxID=1126212 RepID=K2SAT7_MACPH|nr:hypothetical protein MPH_00603 [Macrophomina phaseolina MS6]